METGMGLGHTGGDEKAFDLDPSLPAPQPESALKPSSPPAVPASASASATTPSSSAAASSRLKPDYVLVLCYILVYLEVGWLIFMVLRSYSRD